MVRFIFVMSPFIKILTSFNLLLLLRFLTSLELKSDTLFLIEIAITIFIFGIFPNIIKTIVKSLKLSQF